MRTQAIVVYDFETGGLDPWKVEITQVAAIALDPATLDPFENAEFNSEVRPLKPELIEEGALLATRKSREKLAEAPLPGEVWQKFTTWCRKWCDEGKIDDMHLPIPAGHNIVGYDNIILQRYCELYGPTRIERGGVNRQSLLCNRYHYDTLQLMNYWTEGLADPKHLGLDKLRRFFSMPQDSIENAHDALQDVKDTAAILKKLLMLGRRHAKNTIFKDCFDDEKVQIEIDRRNNLKAKRKARK